MYCSRAFQRYDDCCSSCNNNCSIYNNNIVWREFPLLHYYYIDPSKCVWFRTLCCRIGRGVVPNDLFAETLVVLKVTTFKEYLNNIIQYRVIQNDLSDFKRLYSQIKMFKHFWVLDFNLLSYTFIVH